MILPFKLGFIIYRLSSNISYFIPLYYFLGHGASVCELTNRI